MMTGTKQGPQRIFLAGASGNVGSRVLRRLAQQGEHVVALGRDPGKSAKGAATGAVTWLKGDLSAPSPEVLQALSQATTAHFCVHPRLCAEVLEAMRRAQLDRPPLAVALSSARYHSRFDSDGTRTAIHQAEERLRAMDCAVVVLRPTMIWGGGRDLNVTRLAKTVAKRRILALPGGGRGLVQPVHAEDVAVAMLAAAASGGQLATLGGGFAAFDLGGGEQLSFVELAGLLASQQGRVPPRCIAIPGGLALAAARFAEVLRLAPRGVLRDAVGRLLEDRTVDNEPLLRALPGLRVGGVSEWLAIEQREL